MSLSQILEQPSLAHFVTTQKVKLISKITIISLVLPHTNEFTLIEHIYRPSIKV